MRRLAVPTTFAAVAVVAACAWYNQFGTAAAQADAARAEPVVELPLAGLATPATSVHASNGQTGTASVLNPSCATADAGACARLESICANLDGAMADNGDGTRTCTIILD